MRTGFRSQRVALMTGLALLLGMVWHPAAAADRGVLIFAAASTADAVNAAVADFTSETGMPVRASYASSGALARQIDHGAPASLFLSANTGWMDWVEKRGLIAPGTQRTVFRNRLVLIEPLPGTRAIHPIRRSLEWHLTSFKGWLAIGNPDHVPAGAYAKAALTSLGLWNDLKDRTTRSRDVRAALLLVERGEASLGIVYRTDARRSNKVAVLGTFPERTHPPINYSLAIVRAQDGAEARRLYGYLLSRKARRVFSRFGFLID